MTLSEIATKLEAAVAERSKAKAAVGVAAQQLKVAEADYAAVTNDIRDLDKQYQAAMKDILSFGGTVHVE